MALILPPGFAQLVLGFSNIYVETGRTAIVLGYGSELGDDPTSLQAFTANVADLASDYFPSLFEEGIVLDQIYAQTETSSFIRFPGIAGTAQRSMPPPNVAALVSYTTAAKGRRAQGRSYLHGVFGEGGIDEQGFLETGTVSLITSQWLGFLEDLGESTDPAVDQVVLQNTTPTGPDAPTNPTPPITPPPVVTGRTVQLKVATQRRRVRR